MNNITTDPQAQRQAQYEAKWNAHLVQVSTSRHVIIRFEISFNFLKLMFELTRRKLHRGRGQDTIAVFNRIDKPRLRSPLETNVFLNKSSLIRLLSLALGLGLLYVNPGF